MTANITGYAVYQGLATSLDTLCAQAYGSGKKTLVGLQLQRMVYFLWIVTIPISIVWISGTWILEAVVPEKETAVLAGLYLKILVAGAPGYAAFESGKRFLQAQGLFSATLYVLLICAPLNAFLNWLFVWVSRGSHAGGAGLTSSHSNSAGVSSALPSPWSSSRTSFRSSCSSTSVSSTAASAGAASSDARSGTGAR